MFFTLGWIVFQLKNYSILSTRPKELFEPATYFGKIFISTIPSGFHYYSMGMLAILIIIFILFKKEFWWLRAVLTFILLWLNIFTWSWGKIGHVGHLLMISHLFSMFIPFHTLFSDKANPYISKSIETFYVGVLIIYCYSGVWKWAGFVYKIIFKPDDINWLHPQAALFNALIQLRQSDQPYHYIIKYFTFPLFWQISFIAMTTILTLGVFAAFRHPLRLWVGLALIVFHLVNYFAFNVAFFAPPFVIACLFFPYELFIKKIKNNLLSVSSISFAGNKGRAVYRRVYTNGDTDIFYGFYAYRERLWDKNRIMGGLLYIPFLDLFVNAFWRTRSKTITSSI